jgi:hypothetical protein
MTKAMRNMKWRPSWTAACSEENFNIWYTRKAMDTRSNEADMEALKAIVEFYCINPGAPWNIQAVYENHLLPHQPYRDTWP